MWQRLEKISGVYVEKGEIICGRPVPGPVREGVDKRWSQTSKDKLLLTIKGNVDDNFGNNWKSLLGPAITENEFMDFCSSRGKVFK